MHIIGTNGINLDKREARLDNHYQASFNRMLVKKFRPDNFNELIIPK